jgi:Tol biopolymer transport system component
MKKLLLSSIALFIFSISMLLFQISCHKEASARSTAVSQQGKIIYVNWNGTGSIWTANYDGSNPQTVPISLPTGYSINDNTTLSISPDGSKIFFLASKDSMSQGLSYPTNSIFSCNSNGSGLTQIMTGGNNYASIVAY